MAITISGTAYSDAGITHVGSGVTINVTVGGASVASATTASNGTFTTSSFTATTSTPIGVCIQSGASQGVTIVASLGSSISGVDVWSLYLRLSNASGVSPSGANINTIAGSSVTAVTNTFSSSSSTQLTIKSSRSLAVAATFPTAVTTTLPSHLRTTSTMGSLVCSGTLLLDSNLTVISGGSLNVSVGLLLQGNNLTVTGVTITNSGTIGLLGSETLTGFINDTANNGFISYSGSSTYTSLAAGNSYARLSFGGTGTYQPSADVTVLGDLAIGNGAATLDMSNANKNLGVGGNWSLSGSGSFIAGTGTVTLNGTNQTISGSTTFYNLTKTVAAADTLTFTDGTTQTVTNSLTLNGASGQLLTLTGTSTGGWTISCPVTQSLTYVKPDHSTATTNTAAAGTGSVNGGSNTNWSFPSADPFPASYLRIQQFYFLPDVDSSWWSGQQTIKSQLPPIQQPIPILQQQLLLESCDVQQQIRQQPVLVTSLSGSFPRQQLQDSNNWVQPEFSYRTVSSLVAFTIPTQSRSTTVPEYQKENIDWWYEQPRTIIVQASIPSAVLSWSGITQTTMQQSGISSTIMQKVGATSTSLSWVGRTL